MADDAAPVQRRVTRRATGRRRPLPPGQSTRPVTLYSASSGELQGLTNKLDTDLSPNKSTVNPEVSSTAKDSDSEAFVSADEGDAQPIEAERSKLKIKRSSSFKQFSQLDRDKKTADLEVAQKLAELKQKSEEEAEEAASKTRRAQGEIARAKTKQRLERLRQRRSTSEISIDTLDLTSAPTSPSMLRSQSVSLSATPTSQDATTESGRRKRTQPPIASPPASSAIEQLKLVVDRGSNPLGFSMREMEGQPFALAVKVLKADGMAQASGMRVGDFLISVDGVDVSTMSVADAKSLLTSSGEVVNITVGRLQKARRNTINRAASNTEIARRRSMSLSNTQLFGSTASGLGGGSVRALPTPTPKTSHPTTPTPDTETKIEIETDIDTEADLNVSIKDSFEEPADMVSRTIPTTVATPIPSETISSTPEPTTSAPSLSSDSEDNEDEVKDMLAPPPPIPTSTPPEELEAETEPTKAKDLKDDNNNLKSLSRAAVDANDDYLEIMGIDDTAPTSNNDTVTNSTTTTAPGDISTLSAETTSASNITPSTNTQRNTSELQPHASSSSSPSTTTRPPTSTHLDDTHKVNVDTTTPLDHSTNPTTNTTNDHILSVASADTLDTFTSVPPSEDTAKGVDDRSKSRLNHARESVMWDDTTQKVLAQALEDQKPPPGTIETSPSAQFQRLVEELSKHDFAGFKREWQVLTKVGKGQPTTQSELPENASKNRYSNIKAFDTTRVHLKLINGDPSSDYINANFITSGSNAQRYVACDGPTPNTFESFWRMIWELETTLILVLTKEMENGRRKCDRYWPGVAQRQLRYNDIVVTVDTTEDTESLCVTRQFTLQRNNVVRTVKHMCYTAWPEEGVPEETDALLAFQRAADTKAHTTPVVVHCSAGVGRTGVFIAIDMLDEDVRTSHAQRSVAEVVTDMRMCRTMMVQALSQYIYVYRLYQAILQRDEKQRVANEQQAEAKKAIESVQGGESVDVSSLQVLPLADWQVEHVRLWLSWLGLQQVTEAASTHGIDGSALLTLSGLTVSAKLTIFDVSQRQLFLDGLRALLKDRKNALSTSHRESKFQRILTDSNTPAAAIGDSDTRFPVRVFLVGSDMPMHYTSIVASATTPASAVVAAVVKRCQVLAPHLSPRCFALERANGNGGYTQLDDAQPIGAPPNVPSSQQYSTDDDDGGETTASWRLVAKLGVVDAVDIAVDVAILQAETSETKLTIRPETTAAMLVAQALTFCGSTHASADYCVCVAAGPRGGDKFLSDEETLFDKHYVVCRLASAAESKQFGQPIEAFNALNSELKRSKDLIDTHQEKHRKLSTSYTDVQKKLISMQTLEAECARLRDEMAQMQGATATATKSLEFALEQSRADVKAATEASAEHTTELESTLKETRTELTRVQAENDRLRFYEKQVTITTDANSKINTRMKEQQQRDREIRQQFDQLHSDKLKRDASQIAATLKASLAGKEEFITALLEERQSIDKELLDQRILCANFEVRMRLQGDQAPSMPSDVMQQLEETVQSMTSRTEVEARLLRAEAKLRESEVMLKERATLSRSRSSRRTRPAPPTENGNALPTPPTKSTTLPTPPTKSTTLPTPPTKTTTSPTPPAPLRRKSTKRVRSPPTPPTTVTTLTTQKSMPTPPATVTTPTPSSQRPSSHALFPLCGPGKVIQSTKLEKTSDGLGISLVSGGKAKPIDGKSLPAGIFVKTVRSGSIAHMSGLLKFDQLIEVNGSSMLGLSKEQALTVLKATSSPVLVVYSRDAHLKNVVPIMPGTNEEILQKQLEAQKKRVAELETATATAPTSTATSDAVTQLEEQLQKVQDSLKHITEENDILRDELKTKATKAAAAVDEGVGAEEDASGPIVASLQHEVADLSKELEMKRMEHSDAVQSAKENSDALAEMEDLLNHLRTEATHLRAQADETTAQLVASKGESAQKIADNHAKFSAKEAELVAQIEALQGEISSMKGAELLSKQTTMNQEASLASQLEANEKITQHVSAQNEDLQKQNYDLERKLETMNSSTAKLSDELTGAQVELQSAMSKSEATERELVELREHVANTGMSRDEKLESIQHEMKEERELAAGKMSVMQEQMDQLQQAFLGQRTAYEEKFQQAAAQSETRHQAVDAQNDELRERLVASESATQRLEAELQGRLTLIQALQAERDHLSIAMRQQLAQSMRRPQTLLANKGKDSDDSNDEDDLKESLEEKTEEATKLQTLVDQLSDLIKDRSPELVAEMDTKYQRVMGRARSRTASFRRNNSRKSRSGSHSQTAMQRRNSRNGATMTKPTIKTASTESDDSDSD
eukprot:m.169200 g.169200  ORF g.169200 m.169200 type:complete len:2299 (-) comp31556_c1_seq2:16-6912(-)